MNKKLTFYNKSSPSHLCYEILVLSNKERVIFISAYEKLKDILSRYESALVAFSGGVDSTFLAKVTYDTLKDKAIAVTICSAMNPERELKDAKEFAKKIGIKHMEIAAMEFENQDFVKNDRNKCYHCKKSLFLKLQTLATEKGFKYVVEGSNIDDEKDYRPGRKAIAELGIKSPLCEAGLTKYEIRVISQKLNLPTWNKPSFACLASRIPYGTAITPKILQMIGEAEDYLIDIGFTQVRVRYHNEVARIELPSDDIKKIFDNGCQTKIYSKFRAIGFLYTTVDILGYRTGSMNDSL